MTNNNTKWKYRCLAVAATAFIALNAAHSLNTVDYNRIRAPYEIELPDDVIKPYASYSLGNVYIGSYREIRKITPYVEYNDVLVIDETNSANPNFHIINSYRILFLSDKKDIIDILKRYDVEHNNTWNRSIRSSLNEWTAHNLLFNFDIKTDHTTDVDLDNNDETRFKIFTLK